MSNKIKSPQEFLININLLHLISLTNIEDVIKQAQRQAYECGRNEALELAAERAVVINIMEKIIQEDCVQCIKSTVVDRQSILNLKNSEELRV